MPHPLRWSLVLLLCWCALARAQGIPVYDNTNFLQNLITAAQSTLTSIATAQTAANTLLDLTPLDEMIMASGIIEAATQLADILQQIEGLDNDIQSLQRQITALFGLETAPASASALRERLAEIRRLRWQCYSYAMKLQTLIKTALRTIQHLGTLVSSIRAFLGAKQGIQTLTQVAASTNNTLTILAAQTAAYQRAGSVDKMEELLTIESLQRIQADMLSDWPRRR
jgi:conjugal transfer/entry exclusion protein